MYLLCKRVIYIELFNLTASRDKRLINLSFLLDLDNIILS